MSSRLNYNLNWNNHFELDMKSPSGLKWNKNVIVGRGRKLFSKGEFCLSKDSCGYWIVHTNSKSYKSHIIVYILHYGTKNYLFDTEIDHINGDRSDNRIENLRLVSSEINKRNVKMKSHNTSGVTGVTLFKHWYKSKITYKNKEYAKLFSTLKYGKEKAFELACQWRESKLQSLIQAGAEFTDRHGKGD